MLPDLKAIGNTRVLVVDDAAEIHDDFTRILCDDRVLGAARIAGHLRGAERTIRPEVHAAARLQRSRMRDLDRDVEIVIMTA